MSVGREFFAIAKIHYSIRMSSCMSATDSADKESLIYKTFSSHLLQTPQSNIDCLSLFFEFRTNIPLENHCFGDRPFLPFEVGRARAISLISLAWLKLTT